MKEALINGLAAAAGAFGGCCAALVLHELTHWMWLAFSAAVLLSAVMVGAVQTMRMKRRVIRMYEQTVQALTEEGEK